MIIGYTCGVFDLIHEGHINILRNAKKICDKLIVGLTTDEGVKYKFKNTIIKYNVRKQILESIKYVDLVIPQDNTDKIIAWKKIKYDYLFVGDDWYNTEKWNNIEKQLNNYNVKIIYFPYTKSSSTTLIKKSILNLQNVFILFDLDNTLWDFYTNLLTQDEFENKLQNFNFSDDIIRIFNYLHLHNIQYAFVSRSKFYDRCKKLLSKLNIDLDNTYNCIKYTEKKTKLYHCQEIIKKSNVTPEFMILFDDDKENLESVNNLINKTILVKKDKLLTFENFIFGLA